MPASPTATAPAHANGIEKKNGSTAIGLAYTATQTARSVHIKGSYTASIEAFNRILAKTPTAAQTTSATASVTPTATPTKPAGRPLNSAIIDTTGWHDKYKATIVIGDLTASITRTGTNATVQANASLAARLSHDELATGPRTLPVTSKIISGLVQLTDPSVLTAAFLNNKGVPLSYTTGATTNNATTKQVQVLVAEKNNLVGSVVLSTVGKPVPLKATITDATGGLDLRLSDWR